MNAHDNAEAPGVRDEQLGVVNSELAEERQRRVRLSREVRILEDRIAEARSEVLRREQAAQAARFRVVAETEARLAAESRLAAAEERAAELADRAAELEDRAAELAENLQEVYATRTFRYTRGLRKLYGSAVRRRQPRHPAG